MFSLCTRIAHIYDICDRYYVLMTIINEHDKCVEELPKIAEIKVMLNLEMLQR